MPITLPNPVQVNIAELMALAAAAKSLQLKSANIRALRSGGYASVFKGRGMEFSESRPYQPGDDVRNIDWKITARSGKTYTKLFQEERERPVIFWVDQQAGMRFATRGMFKSVIAAKAATLLGWSAMQQGDRVGGLIFTATRHHELKPKSGKNGILTLIRTLVDISLQGETSATAAPSASISALMRLRNVTHPGSLIVLCTDTADWDAKVEPYLSDLTQHNELVLIHISDILERELPQRRGYYRFSNGSRDCGLQLDAELQRKYNDKYQLHREFLQKLCDRYRIAYLSLDTRDAIIAKLAQHLQWQMPQQEAV